MNSQSTEAATSSRTDQGGSSGRRRSRSFANTIQKKNQEELDDGISKKKPKPKLPMELAFENDVVLLKVFHHSSPLDLKEFRLVNRKWNDTATSTLLIRKSLELKLHELKKYGRGIAEFTSDPGTSALPLSSQAFASGSLGSITDLCHLIESSTKFPTKSLSFKHNFAESHSQVRQLLKIFGKQVKELTFDYHCEISISFLRELLLDLVPNLESLVFYHCILETKQPLSTTDKNGDNSFDCQRIQSLPHLTQLAFSLTKNWDRPRSDYRLQLELFRELVDAAVNLRSVYAKPLDFLEVLLDGGKLHLVNRLSLVPTREVEKRHGGAEEVRSFTIYQKLASMKPEIKTLKMRCVNEENGYGSRRFELLEKSMFESTVNSVLESSKNSLRDLRIKMERGFLIDLPVLPNLKKLKIATHIDQEEHFSVGLSAHNTTFSFQTNFPHLHEFHLFLFSYMDVDLKKMFCGQLEKWMSPTVKHLKFGGNMSYQDEGEIDSPYEGPQTLGKMFPNAISVVIAFDFYMYTNVCIQEWLSSIIWQQIPADVKSLSITKLAFEEECEDFQDFVDTFFTGMPIIICRRLRKLPYRICEEKDSLDALRTKPSICVLKNLEELNICCNDLRSPHPFASHVTGLYAFDLMPQLKVTVSYVYKPNESIEIDGSRKLPVTPSEDMNRSMKHIAPYITQVCHEKSYKDFY